MLIWFVETVVCFQYRSPTRLVYDIIHIISLTIDLYKVFEDGFSRDIGRTTE